MHQSTHTHDAEPLTIILQVGESEPSPTDVTRELDGIKIQLGALAVIEKTLWLAEKALDLVDYLCGNGSSSLEQ